MFPYAVGDLSALDAFEVIVLFWFVGFVINWLFRMVMAASTDGQFR